MHLHIEAEGFLKFLGRIERKEGSEFLTLTRTGQEEQKETTTNLTDNLVKIDVRTGGGKKDMKTWRARSSILTTLNDGHYLEARN